MSCQGTAAAHRLGEAGGLRAWLRLLATPKGEEWLARPKGMRWNMVNAPEGVLALVLEHGLPFRPVAWSTWSEPYERGLEGECTRNAWRLVEGTESRLPRVWYCEGYGWQGDYALLPIAHAWAVTEDGRVIDPTWREHPTYPLEQWEYLGVPLAAEFVRRKHGETGRYSILPALEGEVPPEALAEPWRAAA
jgi:hypothetical protein